MSTISETETTLPTPPSGKEHFAGDAPVEDQRGHDRHEIMTDGQIVLPNGFKIDIRVVDMSRTGARLRMLTHVVLPPKFDVEIFSPDRMKLKVTTSERQWQRLNLCGVKFLQSRIRFVNN